MHRVLGVAAILVWATGVSADALTFPITTGNQTIRLGGFVTIPSTQGSAMELTYAPGTSADRVYIAARNGQVRLVEGGVMASTSFLNLPARGVTVTTGGERGLLGLAFHPDFAVSGSAGFGRFYTHTSEPRVGSADFSHPELDAANTGDHHAVIREWTVDPASPNVVLGSSRVLMRINQPQGNHNGGAIIFGADKNLYIALGDGGGGNDGLPGPTQGFTNGTGNAQDTTNVFGSILRIDPVGSGSANSQYGVPGDNPFVGQTGVDEIYAYGLRNPWKASFDRMTGTLYAADVGQSRREEVNIITAGGNYGWVYREGTIATPNIGVSPPPGAEFIDPIAEYVNRATPGAGGRDGNSVIGGFVYRGDAIPQLRGKYVFGDLLGLSSVNRGRLFYVDAGGGEIFEFQLDPSGLGVPGSLIGFGEDAVGELYAYFGGGQVYRINADPALPGDANLDGRVDIGDLGILAANWQQSDRLWEHGDFSGDYAVTIADLGILAANWQAGVENGVGMSFDEALSMFDMFDGVVVPEPSSSLMLVLGVTGMLGRRRGRGSATWPRR
jgi:glucose/arabinose dehydrogenase